MLNLHNTIYSQFIDEFQIKGSFTKEQRNNILTIEMNSQIRTQLNTFTFAAYVVYYLWSMVSTNHLD
jgi:hypothetical protein